MKNLIMAFSTAIVLTFGSLSLNAIGPVCEDCLNLLVRQIHSVVGLVVSGNIGGSDASKKIIVIVTGGRVINREAAEQIVSDYNTSVVENACNMPLAMVQGAGS